MSESMWRDTPEEAVFRTDLQAWLAAHTPSEALPDEAEARAAAMHAWHRSLADAGYIGLSLPAQFGGRGLDARYDSICNEEFGLAGAPPAPAIGHLYNIFRKIQGYTGTGTSCT